jgi:Zn-dependent M28 family amino/carboxypeptidase
MPHRSAYAIVALLVSLGCAQAQTPAATAPGFDGARAHEHVRQLVALGPRVAGTPGAKQTRDYISNQMKLLGLPVEEQPFEGATPIGPVKMVNLRVMIPGGGGSSTDASTSSGQDRLIIAGHYDTKRFREFTFVGASDGGSSTAFLIEIARALKSRKNALPIELLFLDGEEAVGEWQGTDHTYGSRYYVEAARKSGTVSRIQAFILVDMIGDRNLTISRESKSTTWLTDIIWATARRLNRREFLDGELAIEDDHVPFLEAGVPAVDIIDFDYPAWHTAGDTLDKVSAGSLQVVGDVLLAALPEIEKRLLEPRSR